MNAGIFRLIFNKRLGMLVPVAEVSAAQGKGDGSVPSSPGFARAGGATRHPRLKRLAVLLAASLGIPLAQANPANPTVVSGSASFNQSGSTLTVTNTPNAIINWGSFSIGQNELTRFVQQNSASAVLNRVTGQDPSQILGQLQSNGRVFIINPNGVLFGQGAQIDVAGLIASSLDISNEDFLNGKLKFAGTGTEGAVSNAGNITTPSGGQVVLIAPNVENSGVITSPNGEILLAAGHTVELTDTLNPALRVEITAPEGQALNLGTLIAEGGRIGMYAGLVTQAGTVSATSAVAEGGRIYLKGTQAVTLTEDSVTEASGTTGGEIRVLADDQVNAHGTLTANGGGFIETSAATVDIAGAKVSAGQGGQWLIDPTDVTIGDAEATTIVGSLDIGTDVVVQTTGTAGDTLGTGNITVSSAIAKTAGGDATLTLSAHNNIAVNANITSTSGLLNLNLYADSDATGGGSTTVSTGRTINANGGITSFAGGLTLASGTLSNTTLTTATGATVASTGTSTLNNVTLDANLTVNDGTTLTLLNGLTLANGHTLTLASAGYQTYLNFNGSQTIGGTGEIVFGGTSGVGYIQPTAGSTTLTLGSGITVHGSQSGSFYENGLAGIGYVNQGVIDADTAGKYINLNGNWTNTGTLKASAGTLNLYDTWTRASLGTWDSTGGTIYFRGILDNSGAVLDQGSSTGLLNLSGATINNGTIAGGVQLATVGYNTFNGVTLDANLTVNDGTTLTLLNGLTLANGHTLTLASAGYQTYLNFNGSQTIGGTGEIVFGGTSGVGYIQPTAGSTTLTLGSGITVHGSQSGSFYENGLAGIGYVNQGVIDADTAGKYINLNGNWTNTGTLKASAGTLNLYDTWTRASLGTWDSTGGTIYFRGILDNSGAVLDQGSSTGLLNLSGSTINNGTIAGGVQLTGSNTFDGVTLDMDLAVLNGTSLVLLNGLTFANGHTLTLASTASTTNLNFSGSQTIGGTGGIVFGGTLGYNYINPTTSNTTLTIGPNVTVSGTQTGTFHDNGLTNVGYVNEGVIEASTAGKFISLYGNWDNNGTLQASAGTLGLAGTFTTAGLGTILNTGGAVRITGTGLIDNTGSTLDIGTNGQFGAGGLETLFGTIKNGTIIAGADNKILTSSSGKLDNVALGSNLSLSGPVYILGDLTLADGVNFDTGSSNVLFSSAASTVGLAPGATSATLTKAGGGLQANSGTNNGVVTIASGVTVQGSGSLSQSQAGGGWINNGTVLNNTSGTLTINPANFTNNGQVRSAAGNITITPTNFTQAGTIVNNGTGTININPGTAWTNNGSISNNSGTLTLDAASLTGKITNAGSIDLNAGTMNLGGSGVLTDVLLSGGFSRAAGTTLNLTGTLDLQNSATPIDIGTNGQFGAGGLGTLFGTIKNGTIVSGTDNKTLTSSSGKLDNVTIGSSLNESGTLFILNNLSLADGIDFNVGSSQVRFSSTANAINLAAGATAATLTHSGTLYANAGNNNGVVTIGSGVTVQGSGGLSQSDGISSGWVNNGAIVNNSSGSLGVYGTVFTNNGTVLNSSTGKLTISGTTLVNNGTLRVTSGTLSVNPAGTTWTNDGLIELAAGSTFMTDSLAYDPNGAFAGANLINNGIIRGSGTLNVGERHTWTGTSYAYTVYTLTNNGLIDPSVTAGGIGTLTIKGHFVQGPAGTLHIDLSGTGAGEYDQLMVIDVPSTGIASTATLDGTLEIAEGANGFYADLGDGFPNLVTAAGGISGSFSSIVVPADVTFTVNQSGAVGITDTTQSITRWATDSSGDWSDAANWVRGVPTTLKDAVISRASAAPVITVSSGSQTARSLQADEAINLAGGSLILPAGFSGFNGGLRLSGGELINNGNLILPGSYDWTAGTVTGTGSLSLASGATLAKSGSGTVDVQQAFNNHGSVDVQAGTLQLSAGGSHDGGFTVAPGATLTLDGLHQLANVSFGGGGWVNVLGTLDVTTWAGVAAGTQLDLPTGGSVTGSGVLENLGTINADAVTFAPSLDNQGTANLTNATLTSGFTSTGTLNIGGNVTAGGASASIDGGTLNLVSGATLTKDTGTLTWSGGNIAGNGTLAFTNGGTFAFGGSGDRVLNAPNVTFAFTDLALPSGSLTLQSGGLTFNGTTDIPTAVGLYLEGGTLTNNGPLNVSGTLGLYGGTLAGAGEINMTGGTIDLPAGSTVNWTATGPMTNSGTLNLANQTITNPFLNLGTLNSGGGLNFTQLFTNQGTVNANAGTTTFSGGYDQTAGSLNLNGGDLVGNLVLGGGVLGGSGTITGNLSLGAATLAPGYSPGALNIAGDLTLGPASITVIELWGATPGTGFDVINVSGVANLDGALNASVGGGYVPAADASHVFLSAAGINGSFASSTLPAGFSLASTATSMNLLNGAAVVPPPVPPATTTTTAPPTTTTVATTTTPTMSTLPAPIDQAVATITASVNLGAVSLDTPVLYASGLGASAASVSGAQGSVADLAAGTLPLAQPGGGSGTNPTAADLAFLYNLYNLLIYDASTEEWTDENCLVCR